MRLVRNRSVLIYELVGIAFIIILGSMLHFTFEWSGGQPIVGVFSAVNESVWEHLKLAYWPALLFLLVEFVPLKKTVANFFLAKIVSVYLMVLTIPVVFYSYTAVTGESILAVDIASFVIAVVIGQLASYRLLTHTRLSEKLAWISLGALVALGIAFAVFTFVPPQAPVFRDPVTGRYGIP
ncbi:hypothetical protein G4O51_00295 [Candidatus Bathyarchaeota archaeon A05DMB-2]|jgi:hypothetical protein|nr:hypothetical protein [Candidatus Bathyarchaeota archaeon A05DMB-2]